ncbi:sortase-dependent protein [Kitasatospora sp. NPDC002227]|uniref:sortase-dependent protein n=1 Tax=Kitasatospora sp. NPDC002227 TaxID=3154773 RepID=UPI0033280B7D
MTAPQATPRKTGRRAVRLALVSVGAAGAVALSGAAAFADGTPAPAVSSAPTAAASPKPSVSPSAAPAGTGTPQVKAVPKGGAQTGEGEESHSTATLVAGSGLAAVGAAGIGFAVVRRRAGARG